MVLASSFPSVSSSETASPDSSRRILVIKLSALGDVIQSLPALAAIRGHHPRQPLTVLTTRPYAALFAACPFVDAVEIDDRPSFLHPRAWLALVRRLRAPAYERVYDLQTNDRTGWYFRLMRRRDGGPLWSGIAPGCAFPHANPRRDFQHTLERQAEQLAMAGIPQAQPPAWPDLSWLTLPPQDAGTTATALAVRPSDATAAATVAATVAALADDQPVALLVPGAAPHRPAKRWPAPLYGALAVALAEQGLRPFVLGTKDESEAAREVCAVCPEAVDLTGRTSLLDLAALGRRARLAVGNDTGPMHLLAATGCPCLVLFSAASDPALCAPRGPVVRILRHDDLRHLPLDQTRAEALDLLVVSRHSGSSCEVFPKCVFAAAPL